MVFRHFGVPPATVMDWFRVSKTTLFLWERQGKLPPFIKSRAGREPRLYDQAHLQAIASLKIAKVKKAFGAALDEPALDSIAAKARIFWWEFVAGSVSALDEMNNLPALPWDVVRQLLKVLTHFYVFDEDPEICRSIVKVLFNHTDKIFKTA